jgi:hypothetical protein
MARLRIVAAGRARARPIAAFGRSILAAGATASASTGTSGVFVSGTSTLEATARAREVNAPVLAAGTSRLVCTATPRPQAGASSRAIATFYSSGFANAVGAVGTSLLLPTAAPRLQISGTSMLVCTASAAVGGTNAFANGYSYARRLVLAGQPDLTTETVTNIPVLVRLTAQTWLETVANGGKVQSASGWDIRFETEAGAKLDHDIVSYDGAVGTLNAWVRIPSWASNANFRLMMYYGKAGLVATEANQAGVYSGAAAAWDLTTGTDLTGRGRSLTPDGGTATTMFGLPAVNFEAANTASATGPTWASLANLTVELPVNLTNTGDRALLRIGGASNPVMRVGVESARLVARFGASIRTGTNPPPTASARMLHFSCGAGHPDIFLDGVEIAGADSGTAASSAIAVVTADTIRIGGTL